MPDPNFIRDYPPPLDLSPGDQLPVQPAGPRTNDYVAPTLAQHWIAGMAGDFDGVNRNAPIGAGQVDWLNVTSAPFNATGNGVTYDTAAIQAAADAIPAKGGTIYIPAGSYLTNGIVTLKSNTTVRGDGPSSVMLGGAAWSSPAQFFTNQHSAATVLTDQNIVVRDLAVDYGSSGAGGGTHAIEMGFVETAQVLNVLFQVRGGGDATAMRGCKDTLVDGCSAFGFTNCAYDHWWGPQRARVTNCYAETAGSAQICLFNPEATSGSSAGLVAEGFVLANNHFVSTNVSAAVPMQFEPLGAGTSVRNVVVANNIFENCRLVLRGDTRTVVVSGNEFVSVLGGSEVIASYGNNGGTPADFAVTGNSISDPTTVSGNLAVLRLEGTGVVATGNRISGTSYGATTGIFVIEPAVLAGNYVSNGTYLDDYVVRGTGITFGAHNASAFNDFSKQIELYTGVAGISITSNAVNYVTSGGGAHFFYQGSTEVGYIDPTGINMPIGQSSGGASPGTFSVVRVGNPTNNATFTANVGVPTSTQPVGSQYSRTDGGVGSSFYISRGGGTWAPIDGVSTGLSTTGGTMTGTLTLSAGEVYTDALASSETDFSHHIQLHSAGYGFSIQSGRLNIVTGVSGFLSVNGTDVMGWNASSVFFGSVAVNLPTVGFNGTAAIAKPTVTGSKGGNVALASLLTALANYGLVTDSST